MRERLVIEHPRSFAGWARFVEERAGPRLIDDMAAELRAQGTTMKPWQVLREIARLARS